MPSDVVPLLQKQFAGKVGQPVTFRDETSIEVDRDIIRPVATYLKSIGFNFIADISGVDYFGDEPRYEVVYEFVALEGPRDQEHIRIRAKISEDDLTIDSIVPVYQGADWHEREAYDMFGIKFNGHPDLRRILMWDGYPYFPLRKDFPLEGLPSDLPGEAFSRPAPLEGGPFVAAPELHPPAIGEAPTTLHEPRAKPAEH